MTHRSTTLSISTDALAHNLSVVRQLAPRSKVLAMVKANAYGHGVNHAVVGFADADALGVACMQEAAELRELGWNKSICLIEGVFSAEEWQQAHTTPMDAMCVIHHQAQLDWALDAPFTDKPVWLKVNTGMNRLGMTVDAAEKAYHQLVDAGYKVILTQHFANADVMDHPLNSKQIQVFEALISELKETHPRIAKSLCNSAGIVNFPDHHADWVRPGIMLYAGAPTQDKPAHELDLKPAMTFSAQIIALHNLSIGDYVGYGSLWQATQPSRIAVVSCGYGDGYPRVVSEAYVAINGQRCPIIGRVSMDMLMADVTELSQVMLGDTVQLWGSHITVDEVADSANTISYELFCRLTQRPDRILQDFT